MKNQTVGNENGFDYNILCYGPTKGRSIYVARLNWEFLNAVNKVKNIEVLRDYDLRADPLRILTKIETPRILIPQEIDSEKNVIYGGSVPITQSTSLVPRIFDSDFFLNDFKDSFDEEPKREDYRDPAILKENPVLIQEGKEGLRGVIIRSQKELKDEETLIGTRYSQDTRHLRYEGLYDGPIKEYLISLEERKRQIQALSESGNKYLEEMV
jgi:hypothetical protein